MQVIGFCRFSFPAEGGFQVGHATVEERIAYLYAPARIEERFRHFETICLPGIKAQTDPDFLFVILCGDMMPKGHLDRLRNLTADMPQARIVLHPPGPHRKVCQEVMNSVRDMGRPCLQFRHDDDDAVSVEFVALLREAARDCATLIGKHRLVGFDWNRGFVARPDARGLLAAPCVTPYWGVAQAVAVQARVQQTVLNFSHNKLNQFMPTVTFTDPPVYVRGHNDHNDSRQKKHVTQPDLQRLDAEGEEAFRDLFAIDADQVRRAFA
ncbi:putative rhamnosyl transferase [Thetidibacter halocola]|uniref:Putative rhamnosyl transferase n=1 Tax=Thetidibacter halocola TaxID=2827239 RepID=A0A8J7WER9_9RHOB|nr:putative rhamnosyl transferase [Thetidibacter halocola]MBS0123849.1 putative rhamnosyl transferase [Thetidibacter halocola]